MSRTASRRLGGGRSFALRIGRVNDVALIELNFGAQRASEQCDEKTLRNQALGTRVLTSEYLQLGASSAVRWPRMDENSIVVGAD